MTRAMDLNADLGEDPEAIRDGRDAALLAIVTSANVACGGHAGDDRTMEATVRAALARGVAIGAHPSYPDRERFGRVALDLDPEAIVEVVFAQVSSLAAVAARCGAALSHVKPHGALYGACARDRGTAEAVARGVSRASGALPLVGMAGSAALETWRGMGFRVIGEGFADRRYEPDGTLRARAFDDALILDPEKAAAQAVALAEGVSGPPVDSICVHGDTPGAAAIAEAVREALLAAGFALRAPHR